MARREPLTFGSGAVRGCVFGLIATILERPLVVRAAFEPRDAIVVLGARLGLGDALTAVLAERVRAAADLYRRGGGSIVVATGGVTHGARRAEADVIADALAASGVPRAALVVERASQTTHENAAFTRRVLPASARVWLVTQPFHGRRAARAFRAVGFDARPWHIDDSVEYADRARATRWLVREYAAWAKQLLLGR